MICHYEILGLTLDCSEDDIKKTYRKLALQYHPDKNPENLEECTKKFLTIQQAYEVLIDPQERAWYDKHRNAILKGGLGRGDEYEDKSLDIYQFFNSGCYSGFDDGPKSFYSVYSNVFKLISEEDIEFMDAQNEIKLAPDFGNSESTYNEKVGEFYAYWESYSTLKSYVWVEKYDTREAPNRQVRRLMEQDNKKLRDAAKKERNEQIRTLVAFVKKRDKRIQVYNQKLRERAEEVNKLALDKKEQKRVERLKTMEGYKETGWSATSELEDQLRILELDLSRQFSGEEEESSDEDEETLDAEEAANTFNEDDNYCVACNKTFKSKKAMDNHSNSKKHLDNITNLIKIIKSEEASYKSDELNDDTDDTGLEKENSNKSRSKKQKKKRRLLKNATNIEHEEVCAESLNVPDPINDKEIEDVHTIKDLQEKKVNETKNKMSDINCNTCKKSFLTRNQLFQHLKESGHALKIDAEDEQLNKISKNNKKPKKNKNNKS